LQDFYQVTVVSSGKDIFNPDFGVSRATLVIYLKANIFSVYVQFVIF
jgi:superfamily II DNA/RNA helicase